MKRINNLLFILFLLGSLLSPTDAIARNVDQKEAFAALKKTFTGKDVDYYALSNLLQLNANYWLFFVDAEPMKGWEHDCYLFTYPKTISDNATSVTPTLQQKLKVPPTAKLIPYEVKNRYGTNANAKPAVTKVTPSANEATAAQRTYAIILSGGINSHANYERYWNDCSFIYQTLVNKYGVPRENIHPIMSDGNSTGADMITTSGKTMSQPLDLDGDGTDDIELSATKTNISNTLSNLSAKLNKDDHLFFFVIDHGGSTDNASSSFICLWNNDKLYDTELAEMLRPFTDKFVNVNVVLGQCYSGGFVDDLEQAGCVVATACKDNEPSYSCRDIPFDEFVYHWTSAVNEAKHDGTKVDSDSDGNGRVTMEEAFDYAKQHDRCIEQPQYVSTPLSVGEDLAFNHLAPSLDLYIKDNPEDTGKEPNMTTDKHWLSPSICVRNQDDGIFEHENPIYSKNHVAVTIYVRVYNRGKEDYEGNKHYVHLYWAQASTGFVAESWKGEEVYSDGEITGGPVNQASKIPYIPAGEYRDVKTNWALPEHLLGSSADNYTEKHHFCLLAKITNTQRETWYYGTFSYDVLGSNNDAQLNISIISEEDLETGTNVFVRNVQDIDRKYTLEIIPRTESDEHIYSEAAIEMELSPAVYDAWGQGGYNGNGIVRDPSVNPRVVHFTSKESKLEALALKGKEFDKVKLKFKFRSISGTQKQYTLDLIQRDESGNIIGGETFIVEKPVSQASSATIHQSMATDNHVSLSTDVDEGTRVRWENENGFTIGTGTQITVDPSDYNKSYHLYTLTDSGELSSASITLDKPAGISDVFVENDELTVTFYGDISNDADVRVTSAATGEVEIVKTVNPNETTCSIDISELPRGVHIVAYVSDGEVVASRKFNK